MAGLRLSGLRSQSQVLLLGLGVSVAAAAALNTLPCSAQSALPWVQIDQPAQPPRWKLTTLDTSADSAGSAGSAGSAEIASPPTKMISGQPSVSSSESPQAAEPQVPSTVPLLPPPGQPFFDVGVGPRIGIGEPTYAAVALRLGVPLSTTTSLSLRPFYVFGNSDSNGVPNSEGEFTIPLTIDLFTNYPVSVYFGPGITWNADSSNVVNFSLSGGLDFRITDRIRLSTGLYYDMDYDKSGFGDWMANAFLYFRL
jgi:hypothetical protein